MNRRSICITALLLICGCQAKSDIATQTASLTTSPSCSSSGTCIEVADPISMTEACPDNRMVSIQSGTCPTATYPGTGGMWNATPLFPGAPGVLSNYCVYDWVSLGSAPDLGVLLAPPLSLSPLTFAPDCNVVAAMTTPAEQNVGGAYEQSFLQHVGALTTLTKVGTPSPTRVAVVDSAVRSGPPHATAGRLQHGRTMQHIIERLACPNLADPNQVCGASLYSNLALPLRKEAGEVVRDTLNGGSFGSQSDLAIAIIEAVADMLASPGGDRMVINLSVAWDPNHGGFGAPGGFEVPVAAVHDALRFASCAGALVFAASGNEPGGPFPGVGPAYPAGWEALAAPTPGECMSRFGLPGPAASMSSYQPLLYAVGGVNGADEVLPMSRTVSRPVLVAPAEHVTVTDRWANGVAMPTTVGPPARFSSGTSIGPAVASAAAALVWTLQPSLSPHDVAKVLNDSAVLLAEPSDFQLGPPRLSRRISICEAVTMACAGSSSCGAFSCATPPAYSIHRPTGFSSLTPSLRRDGSALVHPFTFGAPCDASTVATTTTSPNNPCPAQQFYREVAGPWVHPHTQSPVCTVCGLEGHHAWLSLTDDLKGGLYSPTISVVFDDTSEKRFALDLKSSELKAGATIEVYNLPFSAEELKKASIDFVLDDKLSSSDPLLLEP